MTSVAIKGLSANEESDVLSIEAGRGDHANHAGNLHRGLSDGVAFAAAVQAALDSVDDSDTLILMTADHEHAIALNSCCGRGSDITGLCMAMNDEGVEHPGEPERAADVKPVTVAGYLNGAGSVLSKQEDGRFPGMRPEGLTNDDPTDPDGLQQARVPMDPERHSGSDVTLYAHGPWAHLVGGTIPQNVIFFVMRHASCVMRHAPRDDRRISAPVLLTGRALRRRGPLPCHMTVPFPCDRTPGGRPDDPTVPPPVPVAVARPAPCHGAARQHTGRGRGDPAARPLQSRSKLFRPGLGERGAAHHHRGIMAPPLRAGTTFFVLTKMPMVV